MSKMMDNLARILDDEEKAVKIKGVPLFLVKGGIVPSVQSALEHKRGIRKKILIWSAAALLLTVISLGIVEKETALLSKNFQKIFSTNSSENLVKPQEIIDSFHSLHTKGVQLLRAEKYQDAEKTFFQLLESYPDSVAAKIDLAYALRKMKKNSEAEKILVDLLKKNQTDTIALNNLAVLYALNGETDKAEKILQRVISLSSTYKDARLNLAFVYEQNGFWQKAIDEYEFFISISKGENSQGALLRERIRKLKSLAISEKSKGGKI